jgi:hypothetical protein
MRHDFAACMTSSSSSSFDARLKHQHTAPDVAGRKSIISNSRQNISFFIFFLFNPIFSLKI